MITSVGLQDIAVAFNKLVMSDIASNAAAQQLKSTIASAAA